jgi:hypothetical protein
MEAPQSPEDVAQVVAWLQRELDPQMDVRWNPRARMSARGRFDVLGRPIAPEYVGRWQVIRKRDNQGTAPWHVDEGDPYVLVCTVTSPSRMEEMNGMLALDADGPYAPLGRWLVDFLIQCNASLVGEAKRFGEQLERANARRRDREIRAGTAGEEELLEQIHHAGAAEAGRSKWFGQGADFASPSHSPE